VPQHPTCALKSRHNTPPHQHRETPRNQAANKETIKHLVGATHPSRGGAKEPSTAVQESSCCLGTHVPRRGVPHSMMQRACRTPTRAYAVTSQLSHTQSGAGRTPTLPRPITNLRETCQQPQQLLPRPPGRLAQPHLPALWHHYLSTCAAHVTPTQSFRCTSAEDREEQALHLQPSRPAHPAAQTNSIIHVLAHLTARSNDLMHVRIETARTARKPVR
jgi:hypothetical protein